MEKLTDRFNRRIDYLRISVTDRCNLRCIYCMPECGIMHKPHEELLSFEEIREIVRAGACLGINKVRLTGGEPLVRKDIINLVESLSNIEGIEDISMTTNGVLLKEYASGLKKAGLKRLNVSLDSLKTDRYRFITRLGNLADVKEGIAEAIKAGFLWLKINVILLGGINEEEAGDFLRLTLENSVHVRFLEFMPVNSFFRTENFVSAQKVLDIARGIGQIEEGFIYSKGPAKNFRFKNALGFFGLITPMSDKFCSACNRLRLTSDGFLRPCLHSDLKVNLRQALRNGASKEELIKLIRLACRIKPKEHCLDKNPSLAADFSMCQIGG